jgi:hypothetical protein
MNDEQIILSEDDENEFQMVKHQRQKFQRENKDVNYVERSDVTYQNGKLNQLPQQQHTQKRRITTTSRTFVNGEMKMMNHHLEKK